MGPPIKSFQLQLSKDMMLIYPTQYDGAGDDYHL